MTFNPELKVLNLLNPQTSNDDEYSNIPLDMSDIINICREFNKLGTHIQNQIENILEIGVEESILSGIVKKESLPHIKAFLIAVSNNPYFGDAIFQAKSCIILIDEYIYKNKVSSLN